MKKKIFAFVGFFLFDCVVLLISSFYLTDYKFRG
jgi:hypothetical protein